MITIGHGTQFVWEFKAFLSDTRLVCTVAWIGFISQRWNIGSRSWSGMVGTLFELRKQNFTFASTPTGIQSFERWLQLPPASCKWEREKKWRSTSTTGGFFGDEVHVETQIIICLKKRNRDDSSLRTAPLSQQQQGSFHGSLFPCVLCFWSERVARWTNAFSPFDSYRYDWQWNMGRDIRRDSWAWRFRGRRRRSYY